MTSCNGSNDELVSRRVSLPGEAMGRLVELLDHCYTFLESNRTARVELADYCSTQPFQVTSYAIIDQLAWQAFVLRTHLTEDEAPGC